MTRPIRRGIPFPPPYGKDLPFPSDINSHQEIVFELTVLWIEIARNKLLGDEHRETARKIVDNFFAKLSPGVAEWLEGEDPRWKKFRAVLVKEKALQLVHQGGETLDNFLKDPGLKEAKDKARRIVEEVAGLGGRKESKI